MHAAARCPLHTVNSRVAHLEPAGRSTRARRTSIERDARGVVAGGRRAPLKRVRGAARLRSSRDCFGHSAPFGCTAFGALSAGRSDGRLTWTPCALCVPTPTGRNSTHDFKNSIMATKGKRPMRALTASDKIEAIQRVNDGESKASVARDIGVPESTLRGWCKNEDKLRYMSSRQSTPETDKSLDSLSDGRSLEKRAKYDILTTSIAPNAVVLPISKMDTDCSVLAPSGLDLTNADRNSEVTQKSLETGCPDPDMSKTKADLSRFNTELLNSLITKNKPKPDLSTAISMSAISPLTNLNHMSGLSGMAHGNLGLSLNEIATNLNLIAQLNPSLNVLTNSLNSGAKALRSIRSSKPSSSHSTPSSSAAPGEKFKPYKLPSYEYDKSWSSKVAYNSKEPPVDDVFWYWLKTQQAMMELSARGGHTTPNMAGVHHGCTKDGKITSAIPIFPLPDSLDRDSWFWQYYKQFRDDHLLEDKSKTDSPTIQTKPDTIQPVYIQVQTQDPLPEKVNELQAETHDEVDTTCKDEPMDKGDGGQGQSKARNVLDNLLFNNNNYTFPADTKTPDDAERDNSDNEFDCEVSEALDHGEKFLKWLEACQDPSVTRMQVYQLKGLLDNIRARAERKTPNQTATHVKDRVSRRKWYNIVHYLPNYDTDKDNITGNVNF